MTNADLLVDAPAALVAVMTAVLTPLALYVAAAPRVLRLAAIPAGALAAASQLPDAGALAIALALPYTLVCYACGAWAAWQLRQLLAAFAVSTFARHTGLVFLAGAATWLAANRAGYALLDYPPFWVLLTAAHFHVAGAYLAIVVGRACEGRGQIAASIALACLAGVPLTAAGIYGPHWLEVAAGTIMAASGFCAGLLLITTPDTTPRGPRLALRAAGAILLGSMTFALGYAQRDHGTAVVLAGYDPLASMLLVHGAVNTLGFSTLALGALCRMRA